MEWENLERQYLVDNEFLKVRQDKVKLPNGVIIDDFFVIEKKNVSLIVAMDEEKRIIITTIFYITFKNPRIRHNVCLTRNFINICI